jgi:hypothetical protein
MDVYVISAEELFWGGVLVAVTMVIHGMGMSLILGLADAVKERFAFMASFVGGLGLVVLAAVLIVTVNLVEVIVWALFFVLQGAQPNHSVALYNALLNYTTLQAGYLPQRWHLLEAGLGMAGLLTVAWSTGILYIFAQDFQNQQTQRRKRRRELAAQANAARRHDASAGS